MSKLLSPVELTDAEVNAAVGGAPSLDITPNDVVSINANDSGSDAGGVDLPVFAKGTKKTNNSDTYIKITLTNVLVA